MRGLAAARGWLIVVGALAACRDASEVPSVPGPTPQRKVALDGGGAGGGDAADQRAVSGAPPGSAGTPVDLPTTQAGCGDPAVGVWIAKTFADLPQRWHEHRLSIHRGADGELGADQTTRLWNGDATAALPPLCPRGGPSWGITRITDKARFIDGILKVWGIEVTSRTHTCDGPIIDYNLDTFTGRVHHDSYEAYNNDGADAVNRPYRFRRISCTPD